MSSPQNAERGKQFTGKAETRVPPYKRFTRLSIFLFFCLCSST